MELLMSDHDGDCLGPCKLNCPAHTDCQKYVKEIAEERFVSQGTVKAQIHSILQKFGLNSVRDVIRQLRAIHFEDIIASMDHTRE